MRERRYQIPEHLYGCPYCDAFSSDLAVINQHIEEHRIGLTMFDVNQIG